MKKCSKCKQIKTDDNFRKNPKLKCGLNSWCADCIKKSSKHYWETHKEARIEYRRRNQKTDKYREWQKLHKRKDKAKFKKLVYDHYGNKCACCGETEPLFLEIDHINNDGKNDKTSGGNRRKGIPLWRKIVKDNFPNTFQILCCNCNKGKERNGGICPHKMRKEQVKII